MKYLLYLSIFLAGFVTATFFEKEIDLIEFETKSEGYQFISPLRACDSSPSNIKNKKVEPIKQNVLSVIENNKQNAEIVAVYYRDLKNGPWFGINEDHVFASASLGKIPVMMAVYKMAESNPNILKSTIANNGQYDDKKNLDETYTIKQGEGFPLEEIVYYMIAYSDNVSLYELKEFVQTLQMEGYRKVYTDLGLNADFEDYAFNITAKKMGSIIRVLYNATYLNEKYSEKALEIMSKSTFNRGIKKYLPESVIVANKFGYIQKEGSIHHHDCGIVYFTDNPYLLCVMTKGQSEEKQAEVIAQISKTIYDQLLDNIVYK